MLSSRVNYGLFKGLESAAFGVAGAALINSVANLFRLPGIDMRTAASVLALGGILYGFYIANDNGKNLALEKHKAAMTTIDGAEVPGANTFINNLKFTTMQNTAAAGVGFLALTLNGGEKPAAISLILDVAAASTIETIVNKFRS